MTWKSKTQRANNTISLDMRCDAGRALVQVDISALSEIDKAWLFRLLTGAKRGREVSFGVSAPEPGVQAVNFTFGAQA
jgi:hypothetical protein